MQLTILISKVINVCMVDSNFEDIFDVRHFIDSLRDEVHIIKQLPERFDTRDSDIILQMPPVSWSDEKYYLHQVWNSSVMHPYFHGKCITLYSWLSLICADLATVQQTQCHPF